MQVTTLHETRTLRVVDCRCHAGEIAAAFAAAGFRVTEERPQFLLPMALYRLAGSAGLARAVEGLARSLGATGFLGSPVIARADHRLDAGGSRQG